MTVCPHLCKDCAKQRDRGKENEGSGQRRLLPVRTGRGKESPDGKKACAAAFSTRSGRSVRATASLFSGVGQPAFASFRLRTALKIFPATSFCFFENHFYHTVNQYYSIERVHKNGRTPLTRFSYLTQVLTAGKPFVFLLFDLKLMRYTKRIVFCRGGICAVCLQPGRGRDGSFRTTRNQGGEIDPHPDRAGGIRPRRIEQNLFDHDGPERTLACRNQCASAACHSETVTAPGASPVRRTRATRPFRGVWERWPYSFTTVR